MITGQVDQTTFQPGFIPEDKSGYPMLYNWPYDYISIVETINFDVDVKYDRENDKKMKSNTMGTINAQNMMLNKKRRNGAMVKKISKKQVENKIPNKGVAPKAQNKKAKMQQMSARVKKTSGMMKSPNGKKY